MAEILSIAHIRVDEGKEQETLQTLSELYLLMRRKGYSRDLLYRDVKEPSRLINLRYWKSEEMREAAHEDPGVHHLWQRLSQTSQVVSVIEKLEVIEGSWSAGAP
ncbi:MAG: antibiotic biosynthesis monooxygenase [Acidobacteriia bacterium]|nr:antibiotic biosynthesis monooxygenase [Terriglobia bacterium]